MNEMNFKKCSVNGVTYGEVRLCLLILTNVSH